MFDKKTAMSLFIAMIMILSVIGFVLVDSDTNDLRQTYGEHTFLRLPNGWRTTIDDKQIIFSYFPPQVEDITIPPEAQGILQTSRILGVTYDPNNRFAQDLGALQYYLEQTLTTPNRFILRGLTNTTKYPTLTKFTCTNATALQPVIFFTFNNTQNTSITFKNNCLTVVAGRTQDLYRTTDRLIYHILKVIPP